MTQLTEFQLNLLLLDAVLTGHPWHDVYRGAVQKKWTPDHFVGMSGDRLYYLSDGGYSRVGWSDVTGKLFLTSNSLERPKQLWEAARRIRETIEAAMQRWWEEESGEPFEPLEPAP